MASRWTSKFSPHQLDYLRSSIQARNLIRRLQDFAKADPDNASSPRLTRTQAMVALALLRKVLPDLAAVEVSGPGGGPLQVQVVRFSDPLTIDQELPSIPCNNAGVAETLSVTNDLEELPELLCPSSAPEPAEEG